MAELYIKLGRAQARRRAWRKALAYAIFAGAAVGTVAVGFLAGCGIVIIARAI